MMNNKFIALIVLVAVLSSIAGAGVGGYATFKLCNKKAISDSVLNDMSSAAISLKVLNKLRSGDKDGAIEIAEESLDGAIIGLYGFYSSDAATKDDEGFLKILERARVYRKSYPRTTADHGVDEVVEKGLDIPLQKN